MCCRYGRPTHKLSSDRATLHTPDSIATGRNDLRGFKAGWLCDLRRAHPNIPDEIQGTRIDLFIDAIFRVAVSAAWTDGYRGGRSIGARDLKAKILQEHLVEHPMLRALWTPSERVLPLVKTRFALFFWHFQRERGEKSRSERPAMAPVCSRYRGVRSDERQKPPRWHRLPGGAEVAVQGHNRSVLSCDESVSNRTRARASEVDDGPVVAEGGATTMIDDISAPDEDVLFLLDDTATDKSPATGLSHGHHHAEVQDIIMVGKSQRDHIAAQDIQETRRSEIHNGAAKQDIVEISSSCDSDDAVKDQSATAVDGPRNHIDNEVMDITGISSAHVRNDGVDDKIPMVLDLNTSAVSTCYVHTRWIGHDLTISHAASNDLEIMTNITVAELSATVLQDAESLTPFQNLLFIGPNKFKNMVVFNDSRLHTWMELWASQAREGVFPVLWIEDKDYFHARQDEYISTIQHSSVDDDSDA